MQKMGAGLCQLCGTIYASNEHHGFDKHVLKCRKKDEVTTGISVNGSQKLSSPSDTTVNAARSPVIVEAPVIVHLAKKSALRKSRPAVPQENCDIKENCEHLPPPLVTALRTEFSDEKISGEKYSAAVREAYEEVVFWPKNLYKLPSGKVGKAFVNEKARLFEAMTPGNPLEAIALKSVAIMEHLLLQKTKHKSTTKENAACLERRLLLWDRGDISELLKEARAIQERRNVTARQQLSEEELARIFGKMIFEGRINAAISFLDTQARKGGVLKLTPEIRQVLEDLHPEAEAATSGSLIEGTPPTVEMIIFEPLVGDTVRRAALRTKGAAGVSGGDAEHWRRVCLSQGDASRRLCEAIAALSRRLCTQVMDPESLEALLANRLIPLDKCPGTRPIGIGETMRRIVGKAIMSVLKKDVMLAAGATQVCAGQEAGIEAIIHACTELFGADDADALLLVDATNAFNRLNRAVALHNIRFICPPFSTVLMNFYQVPTRLFVAGGYELKSREGTTQGCPFAMAMYALGVMPLIEKLRPGIEEKIPMPTQAWYADDSQAVGRLESILKWWQLLNEYGPSYGYFPKAVKTFLIVKPAKLEEAKKLFASTNIQIVDGGQRDLGAAIGSEAFILKYLSQKIIHWAEQMEVLSDIAKTQPHAALAGFVHGVRNKWYYCQRTMHQVGALMQPIEKIIREKFLPNLFGNDMTVSDNERKLYALPGRLGGLGVDNPVLSALPMYLESLELTKPLKDLIVASEAKLAIDEEEQNARKANIKRERDARLQKDAKELRLHVSPQLQRAMDLAQEKGASATVTALPLEKYGMTFPAKRDFRDILCLRYGYPIARLPEICACGEAYTVTHSQNCKRGGFILMRASAPQKLFADLCVKAGYRDVALEPRLEPLSGEKMKYKSAIKEDEAKSDVRVGGFFATKRNAFFEFRVFNPNARSYLASSPASLHQTFAMARSREYKQRINEVDCGDFVPMIMSSTGGMGEDMQRAVKHLAKTLALKRNETYSKVAGLMRCQFSFALARAALLCLRGSRSLRCGFRLEAALDGPTDLALQEIGGDV